MASSLTKGFEHLLLMQAGNVQAAMLNRRNVEQPKSTQEFASVVAETTFERDFNSNAWKWAEMFIQHHELVTDGKMENLNSLTEAKSAWVLPFVACLLKQCKPNGFGDMQLTVKDPSGTMEASLHRKVLQDPQYGNHIGVGSVMILNLVPSFNVFRRCCYLNIVHRNVVKVFPADIGPPTIELVKQTQKPIIQLPMWAEKNQHVIDIMKKFIPPSSDQASSSNEPIMSLD